MDHEKHWKQGLQYQPESWRDDETGDQRSEIRSQRSAFGDQRSEIRGQNSEVGSGSLDTMFGERGFISVQLIPQQPGVRDQTRVLELLGRINYRIIKGKRVYIEIEGVVYKTLYGGYWRSVFTGIEHYLLRCEQVSGFVWAEESSGSTAVDLPIVYSNEGWTARGHSLALMLSE